MRAIPAVVSIILRLLLSVEVKLLVRSSAKSIYCPVMILFCAFSDMGTVMILVLGVVECWGRGRCGSTL